MKKQTLKKLKVLVIIVLWVVCFNAMYQAYNVYMFFKDNPQTKYETARGEELPEEALIKIDMYLGLRNTIYMGLLIILIYFTVDYFYDPERHFITIVNKKMIKMPGSESVKKLNELKEDDKGDEDERKNN